MTLTLRNEVGGDADVMRGDVQIGTVYLKGGERPGWEPRTMDRRALGRYATREEAMSVLDNAVPLRSCPDGGTCHHNCPANAETEPCFRVRFCAPFSSYNGGTQEHPGQWKDTDR